MIKIVIMATYLCSHYSQALPVTKGECHKAFITCVDRNVREMDDILPGPRDIVKMERESVLMCHDKLFNEHGITYKPFGEYLR